MKTFDLLRHLVPLGQGVEFSDGTVAVRWAGTDDKSPATVLYQNRRTLEKLQAPIRLVPAGRSR